MGMYNSISFYADCTQSEYREISQAIRIYLWNSLGYAQTQDPYFFKKSEPILSFGYKMTSEVNPIKLLLDFSKLFPDIAFFCDDRYEDEGVSKFEDTHVWICNGDKCGVSNAESAIVINRKKVVQRYLKATHKIAMGSYHRLILQESGKVCVNGLNCFGECETEGYRDLKEVSAGEWHSAGLKNNGEVVACGSNANGQCNIENLKYPVVHVSCGRFHTACLYKNRQVEVLGNLKYKLDDEKIEGSQDINCIDYPVIKKLEGASKPSRIRKIEKIIQGEELRLKLDEENLDYYPAGIAVYDSDDELLGYLSDDETAPLLMISHDLPILKVYVRSVMPLSKLHAGAKYPRMELTVEKEYSCSDDIPEYVYLPWPSWKDIVKIKSVYGAILGIDQSGKVFLDGDPGISISEINDYIVNCFKEEI